MSKNNLESRMNLVKLAWPILIQNFLRTLFGMIDIYMIRIYSENAVGAVGVSTNIIFILILFFLMISTGTSVVISQLNGAKDSKQASQAVMGSINLSIILSLIISAAMFIFTSRIVSAFNLEPDAHNFALSYLKIAGVFSFGLGMSICFSTLLQSFGYSKQPMIISLIANAVNVFGNYCFIFGKFGFPALGVTGVAISTVSTQIMAALAMLIFMIVTGKVKIPFREIFKIPSNIYKMILKLGVPNGGEGLSYMLAQLAIMYFVTQMGSVSLNAFTISKTMIRFVSIWCQAIGTSTMILTGYWTGAGRFDEAFKKIPRIWVGSLLIALTLSVTFVVLRFPIASLWSSNSETINLIAKMFIVAILVEAGRTVNLVYISALKGSGDVVYPVVVGLFFMWIVGVGIAWLCGVHIGWGIIGAWFGVGMDELSRGIVMIFRWNSRKWESKVIIKDEDSEIESA